MQIAICDDIQKELETIRAALDTYAEAHSKLHFDIDQCGAAIDVLNAVENGKVYDIVLMDICMPGVSGTDAKIPVPRRSFEEVQRMYMEYCRKEARR
ncbi:MAG: hypothetical protein K2I96_15120 [Lachnospiraceae bacterium]|nr:hypothetical protein [Lachnospiraceae bacterium]